MTDPSDRCRRCGHARADHADRRDIGWAMCQVCTCLSFRKRRWWWFW